MGPPAGRVEGIAVRVVGRDGFIGNVEEIQETCDDDSGSVAPGGAGDEQGSGLRPSNLADHGGQRPATVIQHLQVTDCRGLRGLIGRGDPIGSNGLEEREMYDLSAQRDGGAGRSSDLDRRSKIDDTAQIECRQSKLLGRCET